MIASASRLKASWNSLAWHPIAEFHWVSGEPQLLRAGERWEYGYWGTSDFFHDEDDGSGENGVDASPDWRNAKALHEGERLDFGPAEFAIVDQLVWRSALAHG